MPRQDKPVNHFLIRVDGNLLSAQLMDDLIDVMVDSNLHLPDMFAIRVHDESLEWIDRGPFKLGVLVEIGVVPQDGGEEQELIKGEITALEPDFAEGTRAALTVRGYDRSHRLHRGTHSRAFTQVTDGDLVNKIAQEVGLRTDVDATSQVYEHVIQYNQTHMAFLRGRARCIGYEIYVRDRTLYFKEPGGQPAGAPLELEWGDQLKTFRPRLTLIEQVDEVTVKGWDAKNKAEIMGSAKRSTAAPEIGESRSGASAASEAFGAGRRIVVNRPVSSQAEADAVAQSLYDEICGGFIEAEGRCAGLPALKAGAVVQLKALGDKLSGKYFVTSATHIYSAQGEYITEFKVHGRRPDTLRRLLADDPDAGQAAGGGAWGNVVTAIVTNNKDDQDQGRVKLKYPWLSGDVESGWARVLGVGAGNGRGLYCLPEVNDEVLVAFEHGDVNRPLVIGSLWNGVDKPTLPLQEAVKDGKVRTRAFKTRQGHALTFVDDSGAQVRLETAGGHSLLLDDENTLVELKTQGGIALTLNDQDGSVTLNCKGDLKIEAQQALTIQAGSNLEISANGNVAVKGAKIDLN
ncbi:MAG: VgrG-related protein [Anaerolineae bacterium]|nr:VgrG-related protein [Anaerolineae bacterium]